MTAVFDLLRHWCAAQFVALGVADARADQLAMDLIARMQGVVLLASIYNDRDFLQRASTDIQAWLAAVIKH